MMTAALAETYRHRAKTAHPLPPGTQGTARLKWYGLQEPGFPVTPETDRIARAFVAALPPDPDDIAGFAIIHRCGADFHFLLLTLWRGNNEAWEAVFASAGPGTAFAAFAPAHTAPGLPRPTFCVWELGIVAHEARAWQRLLYSERAAPDWATWQADLCTGTV